MDFMIRLSEKELDYVASVLAQRPFGEVAALLGSIKVQIEEQQARSLPEPPIHMNGATQ